MRTTTTLLLATVLVVAVASARLGVQAKADVTLKKGTKFYHASTVEKFSKDHKTTTNTENAKDDKHPAAPAWFAPKSNPSLSVHVAAFQGVASYTGSKNTLPTIVMHEYKSVQKMKLQEYDTAFKARDVVKGEVENAGGDTALFQNDFQKGTAYHYCKKNAGEYNGYIVKKDAVRHEKEFILCTAHDPAFLKHVGSRKCVVRATKRPESNMNQAVLWIWCSVWINRGAWFKWDLNVDQNHKDLKAARAKVTGLFEKAKAAKAAERSVRMKNFKVAGLADRPWLKKGFGFRELLTTSASIGKKKKEKGAKEGEEKDLSAPEPENAENKQHLKKPTEEEINLLKSAAQLLKEMREDFLKDGVFDG